MKQVLIITGILFILACIFSEVEGVSCRTCNDIDKPGNCRVSIPCGNGEICSTEEYNDVNGQQAFRLGCVNAMRCRLFVNAKTIFGKREISPKCYECCEADECNANLCQSSGGGNLTTSSQTTGHHTCPDSVKASGCPQLFVPFKDKCYFVSPSRESWMTAKTFCHRHGGNLVSVNSKEEHDFLKGLTNQVNATFISAYWTGGFYLHDDTEFKYIDGSPFSYTHWYSGNPPSSYSSSSNYYVHLYNPVYQSSYKDLPMGVSEVWSSHIVSYGIICETYRD